MPKKRQTKPNRSGPAPERLKIEGSWEAAAARLVKTPRMKAKKKRARKAE